MRRRARGSDAHYVRIHSIPGRSAPASSLCRVYTLSISHSLTLARRSLAPILALRISRPAPHKYLVRNSISTYIRIYRASESPTRSPPPASDRCVATLHCPHQACSGAGRRHSMTTYATTPPPDAGQPLTALGDDVSLPPRAMSSTPGPRICACEVSTTGASPHPCPSLAIALTRRRDFIFLAGHVQ